MAVSFKRPPSPQVVRSDGTVEDRATGRVLGRVYGALDSWHYVTATGESDPLTWTAYATRTQAVAALAHRSTAQDHQNGGL
ncbi:hypothetical protein CH252_19060 [Rhodococcus sp. 06-1477-1B]|nr:hypothetical protein CH252_19060 [Rhodococcus sp. 06-1477-1B]